MKVLLAIDGTPQSDDAVKMISTFNPNEVKEIHVLTVIDMALPLAHDIYFGMITNTQEIEKAARESAQKSMAKTVSELSSLVDESTVSIFQNTVVGSPESQIVEQAEEIGADMIVVGSHGYNRWERLLLGSVSDSVVHHAPCSVLVVRSKEQES